ncbi:polyprenyl synthetase family protein, partial [Escherichia coli]|uniref:polyprenyl synthetase family protein n=1 Tax=Escherichia coli TaxID=562 RepID=UPI0022842249
IHRTRLGMLIRAGSTDRMMVGALGVNIARLNTLLFVLGAVLAGATPEQEAAAAAYGRHVGTDFQLVDDVLDYSGDAAALGKNVGDDLREGKPTLPLIRVMEVGTPE